MTAAALAMIVRGRRRRSTAMLWALGMLLLLAAMLSLAIGAYKVPPARLFAILLAAGGGGDPAVLQGTDAVVVTSLRLPRMLMATLVGAGLALSGAVLQGLFRNPLADPALIGVSSGAALGAAATIVFGGSIGWFVASGLSQWLLPVAAFAGGLTATLVVQRLASADGRTNVATMLLAGVAINAIAFSGLGLLIFLGDEQQTRQLNFWMLGSIGGATPASAMIVVAVMLPAIALMLAFARVLDAMLLGEEEAVHLGFDVERTKLAIVVLAALVTGAGVAFTGVIGFVGLVVPHLVRLAAGPGHRLLLPASALLGAALLLIADLVARMIVLPAELPIGIVTSCVGGPFFLWLLTRRRAVEGQL